MFNEWNLRRITRDEFPDEIDEEKESGAFVVIHLYKDVRNIIIIISILVKGLTSELSFLSF